MKKLLYVALALCVVCLAFADDHIIRFMTRQGNISLSTKEIRSISYDYHNQDSIDKAYVDSLRDAFVRDSLYQDSIMKDAAKADSIGRMHALGYMFDSTENYTIFAKALHMTGFFDTLNVVRVRQFGKPDDTHDYHSMNELYCPLESRNGFTVFAESDSVLNAMGIGSVDDLVAYANRAYGHAAEWYDYLTETGGTVSTGTDYTSRFNALNMFMAYHILKSAVPRQQLAYMRVQENWYWNVCNGTQPYDYYETMLPNTLVKVCNTAGSELVLNRFVANNTLTDEVGTPGSQEMHQVVRPGTEITYNSSHHYNGYRHSLGNILVYDKDVPQGTLHERMRFDFASLQPEMNNNRLRFMSDREVSDLNGGGGGNRIAFANDFFENIRVYRSSTRLRYNVRGAYSSYMSDGLQAWYFYDLAVRMPPLPTGRYEVRIVYVPSSLGGNIVYSFLPDPDDIEGWVDSTGLAVVRNDVVIDTVDSAIPFEDPRIGWRPYVEEEDLGIASDRALRERGYMRGPYSYADHPERGDIGNNQVGDNWERNMRYSVTGNNSLRKILGTFDFKQGQDVWLRIHPDINASFFESRTQLDFIEFVPVDVVNNGQYMEDWY